MTEIKVKKKYSKLDNYFLSDGAKVLIIEDNITDLLPIKMLLNKNGCNVTTGLDGQSAVEHLVKYNYDLLILDWVMPDFSGNQALEYAQKLIDEGGGSNNIQHFIAFSGLSEEDLNIPDIKNFKFVSHWKKPISAGELQTKINSYFKKAS